MRGPYRTRSLLSFWLTLRIRSFCLSLNRRVESAFCGQSFQYEDLVFPCWEHQPILLPLHLWVCHANTIEFQGVLLVEKEGGFVPNVHEAVPVVKGIHLLHSVDLVGYGLFFEEVISLSILQCKVLS